MKPFPLVVLLAGLAIPALLAIAAGGILLKRALARPKRQPEEFALAAAWAFIVGSLVWLGAYLSGSEILGFSAPWTGLTAAHFAFAGFGALTVTALSCRVVSKGFSLRILRALLVAHPIVYLVIAAGILRVRYCDELGAISYELIFLLQLGAVISGRPYRVANGPMILIIIALIVPLFTLLPSLAWAWGRPIFDLAGMVKYHGIVNAMGHVGLALTAFAWARPPSQEIVRGNVAQAR